MWNPDKYLGNLYQNTKPEFNFNAKSMEEFDSWRQGLKQSLMKDLGHFPKKETPLNAKVIEEREYESYLLQRVVYDGDIDLPIPAYILIPKNTVGKLPAVVACHGHGYGSREIVGLNPDGTDNNGDPGYQKNFAIELVKRGFIVIVPELLGFGDRRLDEDLDNDPNSNSCHMISTYLLMMGKTMAGLRINDVTRTIDYLETRDDVDINSIGCMGISGGGLVCGFATALDDRIKAAVVSGYINTFIDSVMSLYHCVDNFIPGVVKHAEMPEIIGLVAPKPLLVESGIEDEIFPIEASKEAYDKIRDIYRFLDAEDKIDSDFFVGTHEISGVKAYDWLEKWLKRV
ncbi:MAG TPA: alpha/beta hydrolase family protein [Clostridia bacterium]|nr:alpha/beta hydrolase family protein [Clostridia bacterium]